VAPIILGLLIFATLYLGGLVLLTGRAEREAVGLRLRDIEMSRTPRAVQLRLPFHKRALIPFVKWGAGLVLQVAPPKSSATVRRYLLMAGRRQSDPVVWIFFKWLGMATLGGLVYAVSLRQHWRLPLLVSGVVASVGLAYVWPELRLRRAIRRRRTAITRELPETLDLLTITVEAGLGLDQALEVVTKRRRGPLSDEIRAYLDEIRLGADRKEALRAIGTRTGMEELVSLTATLVQALDFGISIANILRVQSDDVRTRRRQQIEERAMKASIKLLFPIIFLILPALFVVVAGPGLIRVFTEFITPNGPGPFVIPSAPGR
jgi:tight adherence protein C